MVMNYRDVKILIPTCNQYIHLTQGLMYTMKKFWPNHGNVIILGYEPPKFRLNDNWSFVYLGKQTGPQDWSNDLIRFFESFSDEFFINIIDDTLMTRSADEFQIEYIFNYLKNNSDVGKAFLHGSLINDNISKLSFIPNLEYNLVDIPQDSNYRTSIQSAIWRKSYFLQLLKPNLTPWQFELQHIKNDGIRIISTMGNHPTMYSHLYRVGGKFMRDEWFKSVFEPTEIPFEDRDKLIKMLKLPV